MEARRLVGINVKRLRLEEQLSPAVLACRAGVSAAWLTALEEGGKNPTLRHLDNLARALDVPLTALFRACQ